MVDYLIFEKLDQPNSKDIPLFVIEETKTDDSESRNSSVYQRGHKFVTARHFYKKSKFIMLYTNQRPSSKKTKTFNFGIRLMKTLGITIHGLNRDTQNLKKFNSIEELIREKNEFASNNDKKEVPLKIEKEKNIIYVQETK